MPDRLALPIGCFLEFGSLAIRSSGPMALRPRLTTGLPLSILGSGFWVNPAVLLG
jgi:hypothetical protein